MGLIVVIVDELGRNRIRTISEPIGVGIDVGPSGPVNFTDPIPTSRLTSLNTLVRPSYPGPR